MRNNVITTKYPTAGNQLIVNPSENGMKQDYYVICIRNDTLYVYAVAL
jgi:hypothetical protein|uniref:Uncharacterized protein n=1 Tax=Siphoviridae sp. ctDS752 TaxID=2825386 RepID=A0A8S5U8A3_9CAUD|nr:MAG TPA: hypothetical protein [Siphoviridae sp. ctDS752]